MSGLITMGLGPKQLLLTMGLGSPGGILPPVVIRPKVGAVSTSSRKRREEEKENKFLENWIIEVKGLNINIYNILEKEIDTQSNIIIKIEDIDIVEEGYDNNITVSVEKVRVTSE